MEVQLYEEKKVGICFSKCLKSVAKNRRANQTARAILSAPTVCVYTCLRKYDLLEELEPGGIFAKMWNLQHSVNITADLFLQAI
jgi:hypothetical protein